MIEKTQGFILRIVNHSDTSKLITLYTNNLGKITVAANIPEKVSNGNIAVYDLGNAVSAVLYRKTEEDMYKVSEISLIKQYPNIHFDYNKICVMNYILYVMNYNIEDGYGDRKLMNFLKLYMNFLNSSILEIEKLMFLFDFYFLFISGLKEPFKKMTKVEDEFIKELEKKVLLDDTLGDFITKNLIKQLNTEKNKKIQVLDVKNKLLYN